MRAPDRITHPLHLDPYIPRDNDAKDGSAARVTVNVVCAWGFIVPFLSSPS